MKNTQVNHVPLSKVLLKESETELAMALTKLPDKWLCKTISGIYTSQKTK